MALIQAEFFSHSPMEAQKGQLMANLSEPQAPLLGCRQALEQQEQDFWQFGFIQ